jgi:putative nucleotidyltransferase with HDIG domain
MSLLVRPAGGFRLPRFIAYRLSPARISPAGRLWGGLVAVNCGCAAVLFLGTGTGAAPGGAALLLAAAAWAAGTLAVLRRPLALLRRLEDTAACMREGRSFEVARAQGWSASAAEDPLDTLLAELDKALELLASTQLGTVKAMVLSLELRDPSTCGHCLRVRAWATRIAQTIGLEPEVVEATRTAALLHDLGKIGTPDRILLKPGPLSEEEKARIELHVDMGVEILKPLSKLAEVTRYVKYHHERYDGSGYPDGLRGEEIPLPSRIIAVADAVDAMRSDRPYRSALTMDETIDELERSSGTHFDPTVVRVAVDLLESRTPVALAADA